MKDVAMEAGVGVGTVSRYINGNGALGDDIRERVSGAIKRLNFNPDPIAQSMRNGQTKTFACIVRDLTVPVLSVFVNAMQTAVDAEGYGLMVASSYHDPQREVEMLHKLSMRRTDGMVIATSTEGNAALNEALEKLNAPVVLLDRQTPVHLDSVLIDHLRGVKHAIRYLIDLGHRRIAVLSGQEAVRPVVERLEGFRQAFTERGLSVPEDLVRMGSFSADYTYEETLRLLQLLDRPTAIFAGGTAMLPGVLRAVKDSGLQIPRDISVIGGADSELASLFSPSVTVVRWDHDRLGTAAARFLLNRIKRPDCPVQRQIFPTELIVRDSCGPVPA
nr:MULTISPECIES: LacI family DNA-binding transcriptional regulator [unclassified Chelatococcus]